MIYIWQDLSKIQQLLNNNSPKLLLLDFDGTLAPIAKSPWEVKLPKQTKSLLTKLSKKEGFHLAIISGRKLKDLKNKVNLPKITYAGNHGLEGEIFEEKYSFTIPKEKLLGLADIRKQLNKIACQLKDIFIEDKKLTFSLHYRGASKQQILKAQPLLYGITDPYVKKGIIFIIEGQMGFDIRPNVDWDKGSFTELVINKVYHQTKATPVSVFIGDDETDEDIFRRYKEGITIKVGKKQKSSAKYHLNNTEDVAKFLEWISGKF